MSENRDKRAIFGASHFADEFVYVARYVSPHYISVLPFYRRNFVFFPWNLVWNWFFTVEKPSLIRDRSFITSQGEGARVLERGKKLDFGVNFENAQNVRGVEILRHWTSLLCKSCQTILWLKQMHVSFKSRQKHTLRRFFVSNKMLPV